MVWRLALQGYERGSLQRNIFDRPRMIYSVVFACCCAIFSFRIYVFHTILPFSGPPVVSPGLFFSFSTSPSSCLFLISSFWPKNFGRPSISRPVSQAILSCADMPHIYVLSYIILLYLFEGTCVIGHGTGNGVVENVFADILIP